ncbi:hypothetical protein PGB90_005376 [Kerria lacca]
MANVKVAVVVLGDIARSPRMLYHSYSLNKEGFKVKLIGCNETEIKNNFLNNVEIVNIRQPPVLSLPRLLYFIFKVIWNAALLFYTLILSGKHQILLVQNPPAIPTLFVSWIYCKIFRAKLIIDWHNYAYTILSLSINHSNPLVKFSRVYECYIGQLAHSNLCVTEAMKKDLKTKWNINAITLYDKPGPNLISNISKNDRSQFLERLSTIHEEFLMLFDERTALLVSSTSWTEDEDFSILLDALYDYEKTKSDNLPNLLCVITGKGPLKQYYQKKILQKSWNKVKIITPWLKSVDYPRLLASAHLGVCLHTSSSGLDLPMKVVDMFGSTLPVFAYNYPCLSELVHHNKNGMVFENSRDLSQQLKFWFANFPEIRKEHIIFRKNIKKFQKIDWHQNWKKNAMPLFTINTF